MEPQSFYGRKTTKVSTIAEACEAIAQSSDPAAVVILPPAAGDAGGQDSDVEDIPEDPEEQYEPAGELEVEEDIESDCDNEVLPLRKKIKQENDVIWKKSATFSKPMEIGNAVIDEKLNELEGKIPYEIWKSIFTTEMLQHVVLQNNPFANRDKNVEKFKVIECEMENFLGIILLSGYHTVPQEQHYWSTQPDLHVEIVAEAMSRNRYLEIKKYLRFADNWNLIHGNKMSKVLPLYEMMNENLIQFGVFHNLLSIDESMVPYYGRHSAKMYIKGKPIRLGYKIWCICGNDGFPYHMKIYQGKENNSENLPLGTRVVNSMIDVIISNSDITCHQLYFDNFFTSYRLLSELSEKSVRATGTVRENRTANATKTLISHKNLKKEERGTFDYCSDGKIYVAKWHDNSIVTIASSWESHEPVHKTRRRAKGEEKQVPQPHLVYSYNKGMGGVDLMDRLAESYRPGIRGKKWYWPLFINVINLSVIAAWRPHCKVSQEKLSHFKFRRQITLCSLKAGRKRVRGPVLAGILPEDVRFDGMDHTL